MNATNGTLTAEKLNILSETIKKQKEDAIIKLAEEVYDYIQVTYKELTQKAVSENVFCKSVRFRLPSRFGKKIRKIDGNSFFLMNSHIARKMKALGFDTEVRFKSYSCEVCLFANWLCNRMYEVKIHW